MVCTVDKNRVKTIRKALTALGKKNFVFIMHNGSFPAAAGENTGFGTINSDGGKEFINYAAGLFDAIQMGPAGKTKKSDSSPYTGTIFSNNPLFIDLKQLTTSKWHKILSEATFNEIVENNPNKGKNRTSYSYITIKQSQAMMEAYKNFVKLNDKQLNKEFNKYKLENDSWLDKDSLYEAFSLENGSDYWPIWKTNKIKIYSIQNLTKKKLNLQNVLMKFQKNMQKKLTNTNLNNLFFINKIQKQGNLQNLKISK